MVVLKVMGLDVLDSIPSEEEVDREDSGEDYYPSTFWPWMKFTVPQSQGDPKIVKRGPNFEQKGDQKGTFLTLKGTQNSIFSELFSKSEYVKIVKKSHGFVFSNKLTYN